MSTPPTSTPPPAPALNVEELEKLSKKELRKRANECFTLLETCGHEQEPATLAKAQFYLRQLEHRWDSRVSIRDFILEIIVIALIGGEIYMGIRQERQQSANFTEQQKVLSNMLTSSQSTATTLVTLQSTTQTMNDALQKQLGLFYDVSLNVLYLADTKEVNFMNSGRTNLALWGWGSEFMNAKPIIEKEGRVVVPGGGYKVTAISTYQAISSRFASGVSGLVPFDVYLKNERQEEFVEHCYFSVSWANGVLNIGTQISSVTPEHWSRKYPPSR